MKKNSWRYIPVYSEPVLQYYRNHGSVPALCTCCCIAIFTVLFPLFLGFLTGDFWITEKILYEQPAVTYAQKAIIFVSGNTLGSEKLWTSNAQFNELIPQNMFVFPTVTIEKFSDASDQQKNSYSINDNKLVDTFEITFEVPLASSQKVNNVKCLLFFKYMLPVCFFLLSFSKNTEKTLISHFFLKNSLNSSFSNGIISILKVLST